MLSSKYNISNRQKQKTNTKKTVKNWIGRKSIKWQMYPTVNWSKQLLPMLDTKKRDKTETCKSGWLDIIHGNMIEYIKNKPAGLRH